MSNSGMETGGGHPGQYPGGIKGGSVVSRILDWVSEYHPDSECHTPPRTFHRRGRIGFGYLARVANTQEWNLPHSYVTPVASSDGWMDGWIHPSIHPSIHPFIHPALFF